MRLGERYGAVAAAILLLASSPTVVGIEHDDAIEVEVSRLSFGPFERDDEVPAGADVSARLLGMRDVPMYVGSKFGVKMRIAADRGSLLQIASVWTFRPRAERGRESPAITVSTDRITVTNHEDVLIWRALEDRDMVPGQWSVQVALIGVDEAPLSPIPLHERTFAVRASAPDYVRDETLAVEPSP